MHREGEGSDGCELLAFVRPPLSRPRDARHRAAPGNGRVGLRRPGAEPSRSSVDRHDAVHGNGLEAFKDAENELTVSAAGQRPEGHGVGVVPDLILRPGCVVDAGDGAGALLHAVALRLSSYSRREREAKQARVCLRTYTPRNLFWSHLEREGRFMQEPDAEICAHSDAADLCWGGTLNRDIKPGENGVPLKCIWSVEERAKIIA